MENKQIVIYTSPKGDNKEDVVLQDETLWLSQAQLSQLFGIERSVVTKHLKNIFETAELKEKAVCAKNAHTAADGKEYIVNYYNLDAIISVGYRISSSRATQFRIWATQVLRHHILDGFTINEKRLKQSKELKLKELEKAVGLLKTAMNHNLLNQSEANGLLQVITEYANSWILLQKYDQRKLELKKKITKKANTITYENAIEYIGKLKNKLVAIKEATNIFGQERGEALKAILGSIHQSFGGHEIYPSLEQKAAHLLYFLIKDHPFVDGNKRTASFLFIVFLTQNKILLNNKGEKKINENALVALALLIAESSPKDKEIMIALITNLL
jgi:death-on-curing family protein